MSDCSSCNLNGKCNKDNCLIENNPKNKVKNIIGVMSGKGGVGKSSIAVLIAKELNALGYSVGILDADITGPSVPRLLGLKKKQVMKEGNMMIPVTCENGIKVMSLNFLVENEDDPVLWRGPLIANMVKQFWTDTFWDELDFLIVDMPPGTGDVALTVMQTMPISGIVMVSVPQDLVSMIVSKAVNMVNKMNVNLLGVIENMSYTVCPKCNEKIHLFSGSDTSKFLEDMNLNLLGELPMTSSINTLGQDDNFAVDESLEIIFEPIVKKILASI